MSISIEDIRDSMLEPAPEARRRDMRPRDNQGKLAKNEPEPAADAVAEETFKPVRVWTAGPGMPQEKIYMNGRSGGLKPFRDGAYYCDTPEKLAVAKRALGARFWLENVPESEPALKCDTCSWQCRSYAAMTHHLNNAHGRPQN